MNTIRSSSRRGLWKRLGRLNRSARTVGRLLGSVLNASEAMIAILDGRFRYVHVNVAYARANGHPPAFFAGQGWFDLHSGAAERDIFQQVADTGVSHVSHAEPYLPAGSPEVETRYRDWTLTPIAQQGGSGNLLVWSAIDVTRQVRAEQTLEENEARLRVVTTDAPIWLMEVDADGRIEYLRRPAAWLAEEKPMGTRVSDYITPADRVRFDQALRDVFATARPARVLYTWPDAEGRLHHSEAMLAPRLEKVRVARVIVLSQDLTDDHSAELGQDESFQQLQAAHDQLEAEVRARSAELAEVGQLLQQQIAWREEEESQRARSQNLLAGLNGLTTGLQSDLEETSVLQTVGTALAEEGLKTTVLALDETKSRLTMRYAFASRSALAQFEQLAGFPLVDSPPFPADGQPYHQVLSTRQPMYVPDPEAALVGLLGAAPSAVGPALRQALDFSPADRTIFVPLVVEGEEFGILVLRGPTLQKADLAAFNSLADQVAIALQRLKLSRMSMQIEVLREVDRLRSEWIASVSHEMRTPLGLIEVLSSSLLAEGVVSDPEMNRDFLLGIREATGRLTGIVENLLDLGRIDSGRLHPDLREVDLPDLVVEVVPRMVAQSANHTLVLDVAEDLVVGADAQLLERLIANLVNNAIKYSPDGGAIRVAAHRRGDAVVLSVGDDGIGIPPEEYERIFDRFYRIRGEWAAKIPGVGLGLAVCREIVSVHGGQIWVESRVGVGSTFHVSLPVSATA